MIRLPAAIKADQYDALNEFGRNGTDSMWLPPGPREFRTVFDSFATSCWPGLSNNSMRTATRGFFPYTPHR